MMAAMSVSSSMLEWYRISEAYRFVKSFHDTTTDHYDTAIVKICLYAYLYIFSFNVNFLTLTNRQFPCEL